MGCQKCCLGSFKVVPGVEVVCTLVHCLTDYVTSGANFGIIWLLGIPTV